MMTVNELGEFSVPVETDPDMRRSQVYASCKIHKVKTNRDKECPICGKPFHDETKRNGQIYCSQKCRNKARYVKRDRGGCDDPGPSPEENRLRQKVAELGIVNNELKRKIDKLKFTNAKLKREINEMSARIRELERLV